MNIYKNFKLIKKMKKGMCTVFYVYDKKTNTYLITNCNEFGKILEYRINTKSLEEEIKIMKQNGFKIQKDESKLKIFIKKIFKKLF